MSNSDIVVGYLMKINDLRKQLFAIDMKIKDEELVPFVLYGFSLIWEAFVQGVCALENLPTYEKPWGIIV